MGLNVMIINLLVISAVIKEVDPQTFNYLNKLGTALNSVTEFDLTFVLNGVFIVFSIFML